MAFSNSPLYDTRSSVELPVVNNLSFLAGSTFSQALVNMIPESSTDGEGKPTVYAVTRPGFNTLATVLSAADCVCRGMYVWEKTAGTIYYYVVTNRGATSEVYTSTNGTSFTLVNTLPTSATSPVRFTEFIDSTNTKKLVMVDGTNGFVFTSNAAGTQIADPDFPSPHIPFPVFLNGRLYLAKANTGDIYNSDLNDPAVWTAGNFISTELYPDDIQALVKIDNYILAIGTQSGEYFYDAGNAIGTPLAKYEGATLPFGTIFPNAIASDKGTVMLMSTSIGSGVTFRVIEGFHHKTIESTGSFAFNGLSLDNGGARGGFARVRGELFYSLVVSGANQSSLVQAHSYLYSVKHNVWCDALITLLGPPGIQYLWPAFFFHNGSTGLTTQTYVAGHSSGEVYFAKFDDSIGYDNIPSLGGNINMYQQAILPFNDFGTGNIKTMSRMYVNYQRLSEDTTYSKVQIGWRDSIGGVSSGPFDLMGWGSPSSGFPYPVYTQLGQFRSRQLQVGIPAGLTRLYSVIVDINKGNK